MLRPLDEDIRAAVLQAAAGTPATEAEYRTLVGFIRGLRAARAHLVQPFGAAASELPREP